MDLPAYSSEDNTRMDRWGGVGVDKPVQITRDEFYRSKPTSEVEALAMLQKSFGLADKSLELLDKDLLGGVTAGLQQEFMTPEKVNRRLGIDRGDLSSEQREKLKRDGMQLVDKIFTETDPLAPLVAVVGFGNVFDLRQGYSSAESDVDVMLVPLGDEETGMNAAGIAERVFTEEKTPFNKIDAKPTAYMTSGWIDSHGEDPEKVARARSQWGSYLTRGSYVVVRDEEWAKKLDNLLDLKARGVEIKLVESL